MNTVEILTRAAEVVERRRADSSRLARDPRHADSLIDLIGYAIVLQEVTNVPAEVAEVAEDEGDRDFRSAEVLLNRAEADRGSSDADGNRQDH